MWNLDREAPHLSRHQCAPIVPLHSLSGRSRDFSTSLPGWGLECSGKAGGAPAHPVSSSGVLPTLQVLPGSSEPQTSTPCPARASPFSSSLLPPPITFQKWTIVSGRSSDFVSTEPEGKCVASFRLWPHDLNTPKGDNAHLCPYLCGEQKVKYR